jgi:hypothetical protein
MCYNVVMKQTCTECGKEFFDKHNKRNRCHRCRKPWGACVDCGKRIKLPAERCTPCAAKQRIGEGNFNWRGGSTKHTKGYVCVYFPGHSRASNNYVLEHILVMEEKLGRELYPNENVHHINGVRDDNRPENLELWVKPHPTGVRVEDAVERAKLILQRYGGMAR